MFGTSIKKKKDKKDGPSFDSLITLKMDGDEYDFPLNSNGENVLDAAQKIGLDVPFACKGGVCCTCKAKIMEGSVSMDVNYGLEPDEIEAGYILPVKPIQQQKMFLFHLTIKLWQYSIFR